MKETPNYFAIIPADVRYDKRLSSSEKLMYGEITALSQKEGYCWASNRYFAELYVRSERSIRSWIHNLKECGYIKVDPEEVTENVTKRKIHINKTVTLKGETGRKLPGSPGRKLPANNTSSSTERPTGRNTSGLTAAKLDSFTEPEAQATVQKLDNEVHWSRLLNAYSPENDKGLMNRHSKSNARKKFFSFEYYEREKIIDWFIKYTDLLKKDGIWITTIFKENPTMDSIANYFRELKKKYNYKEPKKPRKYVEVQDDEYMKKTKNIK
jgi:hypothetical protein